MSNIIGTNTFFVVFTIFMAFVNISNIHSKKIDVEERNILQVMKMHNEYGILKDSTDYNVSPYVFNDLPEDSMSLLVNKKTISRILYRYYNKYASISNQDSLFAVMSACDFSLTADKNILSFYIYVFFHTLENKIDGYIGELVIENSYNLFRNYPGYFYQHIICLNNELKERLAENIIMGFYYRDIEASQIESIVEKHKKIFPQYKLQIDDFLQKIEAIKELIP